MVHTLQIISGMLLIMQYLLNLVQNVCFYSESSEGECLEKWNRSVPFPLEGGKLQSFLDVFQVKNIQIISQY